MLSERFYLTVAMHTMAATVSHLKPSLSARGLLFPDPCRLMNPYDQDGIALQLNMSLLCVANGAGHVGRLLALELHCRHGGVRARGEELLRNQACQQRGA